MATEQYPEEWGIPINPKDLPKEAPTLEESQIYRVTLDRVAVSLRLSKTGVTYCSVQTTVTDGDYEGFTVVTNYLPVPVVPRADASKKEKLQHARNSDAFGRFTDSFKIKQLLPPVNLNYPESVQAFQDAIAKSYGNQGKVMIRNQEFPEGSGRMRSGISDFVL